MKITANMKFFVTVLLVAFWAFTLPLLASAGDLFRSSGKSADAFFFSTDPSGCVSTNVSVFTSENIFQDPPGPPISSNGAFVGISQFNSCVSTFRSGSGFAINLDFGINTALTQATLKGTMDIFFCDFPPGFCFSTPVNLDLTWTGTGQLSRQSYSNRFITPSFIAINRFNGSSRPAEASGAVTDGVTNYTSNPSLSAFMGNAESQSITIIKPPGTGSTTTTTTSTTTTTTTTTTSDGTTSTTTTTTTTTTTFEPSTTTTTTTKPPLH